MSKLRPTLWRTCRVIAGKTRLQLLWLLFQNDDLCVADLAERVDISDQNASTQLRALSARGLITPHRKNLKIFYHPEVNTDVAHAEVLLDALRTCCESKMPTETVVRQATAFTHIRRIVIVQALDKSRQTFGKLHETTNISSAALSVHLSKLEARGFIKNVYGEYRLNTPGNFFGRVLMKVARS